MLCLAHLVHAADTVEFLDGRKVSGKIVQIRKQSREFDFVATGASQPETHSYDGVYAVVLSGRRFVLNPNQPNATTPSNRKTTRSRSEITRLIDEAGKTPPDWFESTQLNHPQTLDLSWPQKPDGGWNNRKNVGQFIWDVVNPNPGRWHSGIKLVHHCMAQHKGDPSLLRRDMEKLGVMYFTLLRDFPRAAFWLRRAGVTPAKGSGVHLAECYFRLGNQSMALEALKGKQLNVAAIKLLGEMGQLDQAIRITELYGKTNASNQAFLAAGDLMRAANRSQEAIDYYERVLRSTNARNKDYEKRFKSRARESIQAIEIQENAVPEKVADGTYQASSTGYNGPLAVEVRVKGRKIEQVKVVSHREKQFYAALDDTPADILEKQSVQGIDGVSGATITSLAIINAAAQALAEGAANTSP